MSDIISPAQVESAIREVANRMAEGVKICSDRYAAFLDADHRFDVAYARAYMAHKGAAHEKKYAAVLETQVERHARDTADVAYRHADRRAKALDSELRALQSVGASLRVQYGVAGRGEA